MKSNDPVDLLKEKARRAASRYARFRRYAFVAIGALALAASVFFVRNLPEQKFVNAHINDSVGSISIRGDYTNFWEVTQNEPPHRDLFQGWSGRFIVPAALDRCGDRFAILVHEPHGNDIEERQLFYLLWYLQKDHPSLFSNLVVLQEGSLADVGSNRSLVWDPNRSEIDRNPFLVYRPGKGDELDEIWPSFERHLAGSGNNDYDQDIFSIVDRAAKIGSIPASYDWVDSAKRTFLFDGLKNRNGSINTQDSFLKLIEQSDAGAETDLLDQIRNTPSNHANLAKFLLEDLHLRAAYAYEIYAEGFSKESDKSVDIFGIEDPVIYSASCRWFHGCNESGQKRPEWIQTSDFRSWTDLQPYRQAVMANNMLRILNQQPSTTVPVITAAIHSHLPELRGYLCEEGYDTVGLTPTDRVASDLAFQDYLAEELLDARGTTPMYSTTIRGSDIGKLRDLLLQRPGRLNPRPN